MADVRRGDARPASGLRTDNLHVLDLVPLVTPRELKAEIPITRKAAQTVVRTREEILDILAGEDSRLLVVAGPCSIHDPAAALEYARRLKRLSRDLKNQLLVVMRVYFEKPRTTTGWKGLIYDPHLDGSADIAHGLRAARALLVQINSLGLPAGTEMLDPVVPQYIADLVSWAAIGARTTESQTHRQMASGLSMPVGFKNRTDGDVQIAVDAMEAARHPQNFLGMDDDGRTAIVRTSGNPCGHVILRGSRTRPNYDPDTIAAARERMTAMKLEPAIMVDCSHGNAGKRHEAQEVVWRDALRQRARGNSALIGLLLESNLFEGNQPIPVDLTTLRYGVSVTDECIGWDTTDRLLRHAADVMREARAPRRA